MRTLKWLIFVVCLAVPTVIVVNTLISNHPFEEVFALPLSFAQQPAASGSPSPSRSPRFVSVQMKKQLETMIAGETGRFELEARLKAPEGSSETVPRWDRSVRTPLAIWIASPDNSGIAFIDKHHPDRPHQHVLVKFALPAEPDSQPLTAVVEYRVNSRTISGKHSFWLDIYAELTTPGGNKVQDMGNTRLPFEVDTHLKTKLLMLTVIAAAIFFFIVEWVRVDVVAMAMMVLLPELGLLNAQDTFKGLSSNAVAAIIGVMIISYGLNRAGLVNRMIQPLLKTVGASSRRLTVIFSGLIAVISSVMQNTGAAVLFFTRHPIGRLLQA